MAPVGKDFQPVSGRKSDFGGSPRLYEPRSLHRISVASTGVEDGQTPLFHSPELTPGSVGALTYRSGIATGTGGALTYRSGIATGSGGALTYRSGITTGTGGAPTYRSGIATGTGGAPTYRSGIATGTGGAPTHRSGIATGSGGALTHRSGVLLQTQGMPPLPSPQALHRTAFKVEATRRGVLVSGEPPLEAQLGTVTTPEIILAKKYGNALPPLKESKINILNEGISPDMAERIDEIPKYTMLKMTGVSMQSNDPMFTDQFVEYQHEYPIPPGVLEKFPKYETYPLLLSQIDRNKLAPNNADLSDVKHLRGHNEKMLENRYPRTKLSKDVTVREAYKYVPNFGRVQVLYTDYPDGTSYPLVTLPKMTPYDILTVMEKMQKKQSWAYYLMQFIHRVSCGVF